MAGIISKSTKETKQFAAEFVKKLSPKKDEATIVALFGDLGAGKTTFVQGVGEALGITENMHSPTFVILKRFMIHDSRFKNLVHVDAYRLKSEKEMEVLGFDELLKDSGNLLLIEWPERIENLLPNDVIKIQFAHTNESDRTITFMDDRL